jgi:HEAT repeat protein
MTLQQSLELPAWAALVFLASATVIILITFLMRVIKTTRERKSGHFGKVFSKELNNLVLHELYSDGGNPPSALEFQLAELRGKIKGLKFRKQILIDQMMILRESLSGDASDLLARTYASLDLHRFSIRKLKSLRWKIRAQGVSELANMNYQEAVEEIRRTCQSGSKTLRDNMLMSLIRLDKQKDLTFLDNYRGELTDWMQLNIHYCLRDVDPRRLPDFCRWFDNSNISVAIFAVNMSGIFRQTPATPRLTALLAHSNEVVVDAAIGALEALEAHESLDSLLAVADRFWYSGKVMTRLVRCVGRIVMPGNGFAVLRRFLDHPYYVVRFDAVKTICSLGPEQQKELEAFNSAHGNSYSRIMLHVTEPLLG